jgi:hypothetical protein
VAIEREHPVAGFPARWEVHPHTPKHRVRYRADGVPYDVGAGPIRNSRMLGCQPARVIAFTESLDELSSGTRNMVEQARRAGVPVELVDAAGERRLLEVA